MSIAVVTANFGKFDSVKEIPQQDVEFDRYYYTEDNSPFPFHTIDNRLKAKVYKMMPHRALDEYEIFIWVDGNIQIKSKHFLSKILDTMLTADIAISHHPARETIYEEADFICKEIDKGNKYLTSRYTKESIQKEIEVIGPDTRGLYWNGLFARRNTAKSNQAFDEWFMRNVLYSNFDQINFVDIVQKFGLCINTFSMGDFYDNDYYKLIPHNK